MTVGARKPDIQGESACSYTPLSVHIVRLLLNVVRRPSSADLFVTEKLVQRSLRRFCPFLSIDTALHSPFCPFPLCPKDTSLPELRESAKIPTSTTFLGCCESQHVSRATPKRQVRIRSLADFRPQQRCHVKVRTATRRCFVTRTSSLFAKRPVI